MNVKRRNNKKEESRKQEKGDNFERKVCENE